MWLRRDETQDDLAAISRRALEDAWSGNDSWGDFPRLTDLPHWRVANDLGWFDLLIPEARGGLGLGYVDLGVIFEEAGRALFPGPLFGSTVVRARLADFGFDDVGDVVTGAFASTTRPPSSHGSFVAGRVSGSWVAVESATEADVIVVETRDGESPAISLVRPEDTRIERLRTMDPVLGLCRVDIDDAPTELIARGEPARQWLSGLATVAEVMYATRLLGTAERMLEIARDYAVDRHQFGRPIGSFQALQHLLADLQVAVSTGRAACHVAQASLASALPDASHRAHVAKGHLSSVGRQVAEGALQVMGGIGFTTEHNLHRYYKHALTLQGCWGDERYHQHRLAVDLVDRVARARAGAGA